LLDFCRRTDATTAFRGASHLLPEVTGRSTTPIARTGNIESGIQLTPPLWPTPIIPPFIMVPVRHPLNRRPASLGGGNHVDDFRQGRIGTDPFGAHHEATGPVQASVCDF
jgi:hypothetical protein